MVKLKFTPKVPNGPATTHSGRRAHTMRTLWQLAYPGLEGELGQEVGDDGRGPQEPHQLLSVGPGGLPLAGHHGQRVPVPVRDGQVVPAWVGHTTTQWEVGSCVTGRRRALSQKKVHTPVSLPLKPHATAKRGRRHLTCQWSRGHRRGCPWHSQTAWCTPDCHGRPCQLRGWAQGCIPAQTCAPNDKQRPPMHRLLPLSSPSTPRARARTASHTALWLGQCAR